MSKCVVTTCTVQLRKGLLMCAPHWSRVSYETQQKIYATLRAWRNGGSWQDYLNARTKARNEATDAV